MENNIPLFDGPYGPEIERDKSGGVKRLKYRIYGDGRPVVRFPLPASSGGKLVAYYKLGMRGDEKGYFFWHCEMAGLGGRLEVTKL